MEKRPECKIWEQGARDIPKEGRSRNNLYALPESQTNQVSEVLLRTPDMLVM
jgi:hypothetical protein